MVLSDIMVCGLPIDGDYNIKFGVSITSSCSYDFNNILANLMSKRYKGYVYQMLILGDDSNYYDVAVMMPSSTKGIKRFFMYDTYTTKDKINLMNGFSLSFSFADGVIKSPTLSPTYSQYSVQSGAIVTQSSIVSLKY